MSTISTGSDLRAQREAAGLDVQTVAELAGLPVAFIELLESERHSSPSYVHRVSKAIAVHVIGIISSDNRRPTARTQEGIHA